MAVVGSRIPATFLISQASATGWNQLPLFSWRQGTYQFFIRFENSPATSPLESPTLESKDGAMVAAFQTAIPSINDAIANSTALSRNTPVAAESGDRKFWRIRYDWTSDLDRDGTPDWAEFENLASGGTGTVGTDAFDADSNDDGIKDGQQSDWDNDGTFDAFDIASNDATASFPKYAQPLYALFSIDNASPDPVYPSPFEINNKGTVLYANGTWSGGTWTPLAGYSISGTTIISAARINDHGEIIGRRTTTDDTPGNIAYWSDPKANYEGVSVNGDYPWMSGLSYGYPLQPFEKFSNGGQILGSQQKKDPPLNILTVSGSYLWTLPGNGRTPSKTPVSLYAGGVWDNTLYWGLPNGGGAFTIVSEGNPIVPPQQSMRNLAVGSHGELIATPGSDDETQVYLNGQWQTSKTYGKAIDVASDGTAIGRKDNRSKAPILLNGRWTDMDRYAPEAPSDWASSDTELMEISTGG